MDRDEKAVVQPLGSAKEDENEPSVPWQTLADHIPQLVWIADASGLVSWYNKRWYDYTGTTLAEMQGWGWRSVHHPDEVERVVARFSVAIANGEPWEDVFPLRRADGQYRQFLSRANPIRDEHGKITHWFGTNTDVTEQLAVERQLREAADRVQLAHNAGAILGTWSWDLRTDRIRVDEQFAEAFGLDPAIGREDLRLEQVLETIHEDDRSEVIAAIDVAIARGGPYARQYRVRRRDGHYHWIEANGRVDLAEDGSPLRFSGVLLNVEERRQTEQALRRSEERYRTLFHSMAQGFCVIQVDFEGGEPSDYRFVELNPAFTDQSGLGPDVLNRSVREAVPDLEPVWFERYGRVALTGEQQRFVEFAAPLGRWFDVYAFPIGEPADNNVAILFTDITVRILHEEELRRSEEDFRLRLNALPQMVWSTLPDGYHDFYNDRWYEFTGVPYGSTNGADWSGMFHPEDQEGAWAVWRHSLTTGEPYEIEYRLRHHSGEYRWVLGRALPVRNEAGEIVRWMGSCTDIVDLKQAQQAVKDSEARLRAVLEAAPVGLVFADASGAITGGNTRVEQIVGHPVMPSPDVASYREWVSFHPDGRRVEGHEYPLATVLAGASSAELDVLYQRGDGRRSWTRFSAAEVRNSDEQLIGGVVASIDIDREKRLTESLEREVQRVVGEREAAQEALRQSQKLEAIGQLTGGVAHDFNNLLTPIIGGLDLIHRKNIADPRTQRLIEGALQSAEKARVLVQRLLAFARRQPLQPVAVDVGRIVSDMADLIASTSGPRVRMEVAVAPDLRPALADSNQLEMALLNLCVNARDAMPEGGALTVAVRTDVATDGNRLGLPNAAYIVLSVTDSGMGMDEETRRRAIEPFFSTKGVGKGTGLGLSMVHGLAAQLGGALRINSRPGLGTAIELWLPVAGAQLEGRHPGRQNVQAQGAGIALLVDDEELVRATTASMLTELGYRVVEADSAEQALQSVEGGLRPALLVTDHLMPGMTGTDLALELRSRLPGLPILIVSGFAEVESLAGDLPHLSKPFRQDELAVALKPLRLVSSSPSLGEI